MAVDAIQQFNRTIPKERLQQAAIGYYQPYSPELLLDEFASSDEAAAKNAGVFLLGGIAVREVLKRFSSSFFAKYFSKKQNIDSDEIMSVAKNMIEDKGLNKKGLQVSVGENGDDAFFDPARNAIKVTKDTLISLPHEIGHAVQEHNTTILKKLQRFRGQYSLLALILYGLGRSKSSDPNAENTLIGKARNFLYKYNLLVPLAAFAPELITEFAASKIGIDYLKQAKASTPLIKAAKKHYAVAFCTYLSLPVFAIIDNLIYRGAVKRS